LQWEWETPSPNGSSAFLIPSKFVKNREDRLVVLNKVANAVIEEARKDNPKFVFVYKQKPITRMLNSAWLKARKRADVSKVRVHDLKHTFGRRLRAAGVSFEDRQDLLGPKSARITTHYSAAELQNLIESANKVCDIANKNSVFTLLKSNILASSRKSPAEELTEIARN
jgi:integrase